MKTTKEILVEARALIATPERWTRREYARDADGCPVSPASSKAECWCAMGAVMCVTKTGCAFTSNEAFESLQALRSVINNPSIHSFNDERGRAHAEVLEVFDRAIAAQGDA